MTFVVLLCLLPLCWRYPSFCFDAGPTPPPPRWPARAGEFARTPSDGKPPRAPLYNGFVSHVGILEQRLSVGPVTSTPLRFRSHSKSDSLQALRKGLPVKEESSVRLWEQGASYFSIRRHVHNRKETSQIPQSVTALWRLSDPDASPFPQTATFSSWAGSKARGLPALRKDGDGPALKDITETKAPRSEEFCIDYYSHFREPNHNKDLVVRHSGYKVHPDNDGRSPRTGAMSRRGISHSHVDDEVVRDHPEIKDHPRASWTLGNFLDFPAVLAPRAAGSVTSDRFTASRRHLSGRRSPAFSRTRVARSANQTAALDRLQPWRKEARTLPLEAQRRLRAVFDRTGDTPQFRNLVARVATQHRSASPSSGNSGAQAERDDRGGIVSQQQAVLGQGHRDRLSPQLSHDANARSFQQKEQLPYPQQQQQNQQPHPHRQRYPRPQQLQQPHQQQRQHQQQQTQQRPHQQQQQQQVQTSHQDQHMEHQPHWQQQLQQQHRQQRHPQQQHLQQQEQQTQLQHQQQLHLQQQNPQQQRQLQQRAFQQRHLQGDQNLQHTHVQQRHLEDPLRHHQQEQKDQQQLHQHPVQPLHQQQQPQQPHLHQQQPQQLQLQLDQQQQQEEQQLHRQKQLQQERQQLHQQQQQMHHQQEQQRRTFSNLGNAMLSLQVSTAHQDDEGPVASDDAQLHAALMAHALSRSVNANHRAVPLSTSPGRSGTPWPGPIRQQAQDVTPTNKTMSEWVSASTGGFVTQGPFNARPSSVTRDAFLSGMLQRDQSNLQYLTKPFLPVGLGHNGQHGNGTSMSGTFHTWNGSVMPSENRYENIAFTSALATPGSPPPSLLQNISSENTLSSFALASAHAVVPFAAVVPNSTAVPSVVPQDTAVPSVVPQDTAVPSVVPQDTAVPSVVPQDTAVPSVVPQGIAVPSVVPQDTAVPSVVPQDIAVPSVVPQDTAVPSVVPQDTAVPSVVPQDIAVLSVVPRDTAVPVTTTAPPQNDSPKPETTTATLARGETTIPTLKTMFVSSTTGPLSLQPSQIPRLLAPQAIPQNNSSPTSRIGLVDRTEIMSRMPAHVARDATLREMFLNMVSRAKQKALEARKKAVSQLPVTLSLLSQNNKFATELPSTGALIETPAPALRNSISALHSPSVFILPTNLISSEGNADTLLALLRGQLSQQVSPSIGHTLQTILTQRLVAGLPQLENSKDQETILVAHNRPTTTQSLPAPTAPSRVRLEAAITFSLSLPESSLQSVKTTSMEVLLKPMIAATTGTGATLQSRTEQFKLALYDTLTSDPLSYVIVTSANRWQERFAREDGGPTILIEELLPGYLNGTVDLTKVSATLTPVLEFTWMLDAGTLPATADEAVDVVLARFGRKTTSSSTTATWSTTMTPLIATYTASSFTSPSVIMTTSSSGSEKANAHISASQTSLPALQTTAARPQILQTTSETNPPTPLTTTPKAAQLTAGKPQGAHYAATTTTPAMRTTLGCIFSLSQTTANSPALSLQGQGYQERTFISCFLPRKASTVASPSQTTATSASSSSSMHVEPPVVAAETHDRRFFEEDEDAGAQKQETTSRSSRDLDSVSAPLQIVKHLFPQDFNPTTTGQLSGDLKDSFSRPQEVNEDNRLPHVDQASPQLLVGTASVPFASDLQTLISVSRVTTPQTPQGHPTVSRNQPSTTQHPFSSSLPLNTTHRIFDFSATPVGFSPRQTPDAGVTPFGAAGDQQLFESPDMLVSASNTLQTPSATLSTVKLDTQNATFQNTLSRTTQPTFLSSSASSVNSSGPTPSRPFPVVPAPTTFAPDPKHFLDAGGSAYTDASEVRGAVTTQRRNKLDGHVADTSQRINLTGFPNPAATQPDSSFAGMNFNRFLAWFQANMQHHLSPAASTVTPKVVTTPQTTTIPTTIPTTTTTAAATTTPATTTTTTLPTTLPPVCPANEEVKCGPRARRTNRLAALCDLKCDLTTATCDLSLCQCTCVPMTGQLSLQLAPKRPTTTTATTTSTLATTTTTQNSEKENESESD